jgi:hypothetical protein
MPRPILLLDKEKTSSQLLTNGWVKVVLFIVGYEIILFLHPRLVSRALLCGEVSYCTQPSI